MILAYNVYILSQNFEHDLLLWHQVINFIVSRFNQPCHLMHLYCDTIE